MWKISSDELPTGSIFNAERLTSFSSSRKDDCNSSLPLSYVALKSDITRHTFESSGFVSAVNKLASAVVVTTDKSVFPICLALAFSRYGGSSLSRISSDRPFKRLIQAVWPGAASGGK